MCRTRELRMRPASVEDVPLILDFIKELAVYEKLSHEVLANEDDLRRTLFGSHRFGEVLLAWLGDEPTGYALYFHNYSTFLGRQGLYVEDLYVTPKARSRGIGKAMLKTVVQLAVERGCGRVEWSVLDWNVPAIEFYRSLGAKPLSEWTTFRLTGDELAAFSQKDCPTPESAGDKGNGAERDRL